METSRYLPIIGLEIHVRLKTSTKLFCSCPNVEESAPANSAICPICTGQPGSLPALNAEALRLAVRAGLALGCTIPDTTQFDRKQYFYPDLPKGYQISQLDHPVSQNGSFLVDVLEKPIAGRERIKIRITRAHLEEDAAKNIHDSASSSTLVDYNRGGVPLIEIVTEPDFRSPQEAKAFLQELQLMLRRVGISDADMEKGFMRCDANVSLLPVREDNTALQVDYNPKIEIKNLNSFRSVERAITFEIQRQEQELREGRIPHGATRGWDDVKQVTVEQRMKESGADYRYFPEPDLPIIDLTEVRAQELAKTRELPMEARERLIQEWGFRPEDARFFVANPPWDAFAEEVMGELAQWITSADNDTISAGELLEQKKEELARLAGGWLTSKFAGILTEMNRTLETSNVEAEDFAEFLHLIYTDVVNSANAQKLLRLMVETGDDPSHILEEHNLGQMNDAGALQQLVADAIVQNPDQVAHIRAGKVALIKWFVGVIMRGSEGRANPQAAEEEVKRQLGL